MEIIEQRLPPILIGKQISSLLSMAVTLDRKRQFKKDFARRVVLLKTRRILYCLVIQTNPLGAM